ncbi:MAG: hypothetical protein ACK4YM_02770 [Novosphingobium sp.]
MEFRPAPFLLVCTSLMLSACAAGDGPYPSLAKRPQERITATWPPPPPPPPPAPAPLEAATLERIDLLLAQARSADAGFRAREHRTRRLVAAAARAPMGSEAWSLASVAVAELEVARAKTLLPISELDKLYADARTQGRDTVPIETARASLTAIVAAQDRVLDSLRGKLER